MKLKLLNGPFLILFMTVLSFAFPSQAKTNTSQEIVSSKNNNEQDFITVKGIVETKETVRFTGANRMSMLVTLKSEKDNTPIVIDLGNANDFVRISEGNTQIKALGRMRQVGEQPVLMASEVYIDGKLVKLTKDLSGSAKAE